MTPSKPTQSTRKIQPTQHIKAIEWFRGLAIIFIVLTHVDGHSLNDLEWGIWVQRFFSNGTFYFVLISGYLFWHLIDRFDYVRFLVQKTKNVLIPYFFAITPAIVAFAVAGIIKSDPASLLHQYLVGGGVVTPLWFIPMIFLIFLLSPAIIFIARSKYFYPALTISLLIAFTSFRPDEHVYPLYMLLHFFWIFLLGILLKQKETLLRHNYWAVIASTLPVAVAFLALDVAQYERGLPFFWPAIDGLLTLNYAQLHKAFFALFILALLFKIESRHTKKQAFTPLEFLAKYSFGIFFFHWYFVVLKSQGVKHGLFSANYAGTATYLTDFLLFTSLSIAVCHITHIILKKRARYVTGVSQ